MALSIQPQNSVKNQKILSVAEEIALVWGADEVGCSG
jgi:hypothetical protein